VAIAVAVPAAAREASVTGETLLERQRSELRSKAGLVGCVAKGDDAEILVCGRLDPDRYRIPPASTPEPGARVIGEAADGRTLLALGAEPCTSPRRPPRSDGLDVLAIAVTAASLLATAVDAKPPKPQPVRRCK
jgi:hypothetical protein